MKFQYKVTSYSPDITFYEFDSKNLHGELYSDSSGYVEITNNRGEKIFCIESGKLNDWKQELKLKIQDLRLFERAYKNLSKINPKKLNGHKRGNSKTRC